MTARRQSSATSLSKYAHDPALLQQDEQQQPNSLDFCNAFWGVADGGVDVLFARMRGATRTVEELRNFFKERALIEEEYAKRMAKLSKQTLGRDEIGEMRVCLDTLRTETEKQSTFHQTLAQQIHTEMESLVTEFHGKQQAHKKNYQTGIERQFKAKQTQESYVSKAREKYEFDCLRINSYTAQSSLVQGKELEKIQLKLQRAEQTVQANERDFANFTRALAETTQKWELDWKAFCDTCQDLEEARMDFLKDIMWAFANSVSTVCVSDDESCERLRLALEQMETVRDMENFVRDYGTGPLIPDPPPFISYNSEGASSSSRPSHRSAQFGRQSNRPPRPPPEELAPEPAPEEPPMNMVGVGAGGGGASTSASPQNDTTAGSSMVRRSTIRTLNGTSSPQMLPQPTGSPVKPTSAASPSKPTSSAGPSNSSNIELKIGSKSYPVDPNRDPQVSGPSRGNTGSTGRGAPGSSLDASSDPLAAQMVSLMKGGPTAGPSALSPPASSSPSRQQQTADYRKSAEFVVGAPPPSRSRASSPQPPPSPVMMKAPLDSAGGNSGIHELYEPKLPGEARRRNSFIAPSPSQDTVGQGLNRPPSVGYAGVGAGSRSNSPQPQHHQQQMQLHQQQQQQHHQQSNSVSSRNNASNNFIQPPSHAPVRAASPNSVGISLDASGRVAIDAMAQGYATQPQRGVSPGAQMQMQRRGSYVGPPVNGAPPPQAQQQQQQVAPRQSAAHIHTPSGSGSWAARGTSPAPGHNPSGSWGRGTSPAPPPQQPPPPQPQQTGYAGGGQMVHHTGYAPNWQQQQQQQHPAQAQHSPSGYPGHQAHPSQGHNPPQQQHPPQMGGYSQSQGYSDPRYAQQQQAANGLARGQSVSMMSPGGYHPQQQQPVQQTVQHLQQPAYGQHLQQQQPQQGYGGQVQQQRGFQHRSPSPQPPAPPTGQSTEDGYGILFYVKALYDYQATTEQEFDFQAGDIIAVTETPEDGWWSGELLDEARRYKGRNVFPSNFVCLLE